MLAGYLPFDDDPANPEGDNINLLYKYIVTTPLTFPEYVTPHARDLLKRILVPDPRKRADLFEVARHSWLSDYAHVVSFITSSAVTSTDAQKAASMSTLLATTFARHLLTRNRRSLGGATAAGSKRFCPRAREAAHRGHPYTWRTYGET
jgi:serine/threonine protein kinase